MNERRLFSGPDSWQTLRHRFKWPDPAGFNIAEACCDSWAKLAPRRVAVIHVDENFNEKSYTYGALSDASNRFANVLRGLGLERGSRCGILLAQSPEVLITHFACHKLGMVSVLLFTLFGEDGLLYRLQDSGAAALVTDRDNLEKVLNIKDKLPNLKVIFVIDGAQSGTRDYWADIALASPELAPVAVGGDDPALISYTSGTTGPPKGVLHAHRFVLGHLPSVELQHDFFPQPGDVSWTPADWAWIGGLVNISLPSLYYGVPLVSHRLAKFDPDRAFALIEKMKIRNMFLPPTALKLMRQARVPKDVNIRSIGSGGEALGADMLYWGKEALGVNINEIYGQTECNLVLCSSATVFETRPGAIGKAVPGHEVAIVSSKGRELPAGETGEIAIGTPDVGMFLRYWNQPEKTAERFVGSWMRTGDLGVMDKEGYFTFHARDDDVITSSGYRIGPTEIENCLTGHEDVVMAAAVGVPDQVRTEVVKAFVVLRKGAEWQGLEAELIARVRSRVSPHVAPKTIEPIEAMPMTTTGKIMRRELRKLG